MRINEAKHTRFEQSTLKQVKEAIGTSKNDKAAANEEK